MQETQYKVIPTSSGGYIIQNESEKYLIHKSKLQAKGNYRPAPYCLKDMSNNKHISGMFYESKDYPTFTYYQEDNRIDITINTDRAYKTIRPKHAKK